MKTLKEIFGGLAKRGDEMNLVHKNEFDHSSHQHGQGSLGTLYQCPMKCEGEKTYTTPGNCPVCNMKLVPVNESVTPSHDHKNGHEGHGHGHGHHGCC